MCFSAKRIIVVGNERGAAFLELFTRKASTLQPGDPNEMTTRLGPLSSERALEGLLEQIAAAREGGAKVVLGGERYDRPGFYLQPTVLTDIAHDNPVYRQELFGTVASFFVVEDDEAAIALENDTPYGLGAAIFTDALAHRQALPARNKHGMVLLKQK